MGVTGEGEEGFSTIVSPGKSGSYFYFSPDAKYVIKTINQEEFQFFRDSVFSYYEVRDPPTYLPLTYPFLVKMSSFLRPIGQHMSTNHNSLLTRFFALYTVRSKARMRWPFFHFVF